MMEGSIFFGGFIFKGGGWAREIFSSVADCFSKTLTAGCLVFSDGKVSRPQGRGTDQKKTQTTRRCGGFSPHKPRKKFLCADIPRALIQGVWVKC